MKLELYTNSINDKGEKCFTIKHKDQAINFKDFEDFKPAYYSLIDTINKERRCIFQ